MITSIKDWLDYADKRLAKEYITTSRLDSEIILSLILNTTREYLHAHDDKTLDKQSLRRANKLLNKRCHHLPIAYITGQKEFYGRNFLVNRHTLIPRPESELVIEIVKAVCPPKGVLLDVGTGCGCLGITIKLELPSLDVILIDNSNQALRVAKKNTDYHNVNIDIINSDLLKKIKHKVDIIVANLPYVDKRWEYSKSLKYEPISAIFASDDGLAIIKLLIVDAKSKLKKTGQLILEADPRQFKLIDEFAKESGFSLIKSDGFVLVFELNSTRLAPNS